MVIAAIVLGIVLLAALAYLFLRPRATGDEGEFALHCSCPKCKRRLRYKKQSAGRPAMCPRCAERFTFPHAGKGK